MNTIFNNVMKAGKNVHNKDFKQKNNNMTTAQISNDSHN